jgi:hypothetical protein
MPAMINDAIKGFTEHQGRAKALHYIFHVTCFFEINALIRESVTYPLVPKAI